MSAARHSWDFFKGAIPAMGLTLAAVSDPLGWIHGLGFMTDVTWTIEPWLRQSLFAAAAFGWMWWWYLGVRRKMERGHKADMPLHEACRWIARDSVWAAKYRWSDSEWISRVAAEVLSKWQAGHLEIVGIPGKSKGAHIYLPPAMKGESEFEAHKLCSDEPPWFIVSSTHLTPQGRSSMFFWPALDRDDVMRVWPRRSIIHRLRRRSPVERIDADGYAERFRKQDKWYVENS